MRIDRDLIFESSCAFAFLACAVVALIATSKGCDAYHESSRELTERWIAAELATARKAGALAFRGGLPITANPYQSSTSGISNAWMEGYLEQKQSETNAR